MGSFGSQSLIFRIEIKILCLKILLNVQSLNVATSGLMSFIVYVIMQSNGVLQSKLCETIMYFNINEYYFCVYEKVFPTIKNLKKIFTQMYSDVLHSPGFPENIVFEFRTFAAYKRL